MADIKVWAKLGLYFAEKLRGGIALQLYRTGSPIEYKDQAVEHLKLSLQYWDDVVAITEPIYKAMPLVHFSEQKGYTPDEIANLRFHWEFVRPEVAKDVDFAKAAVPFK